jgi:hypothetical protein
MLLFYFRDFAQIKTATDDSVAVDENKRHPRWQVRCVAKGTAVKQKATDKGTSVAVD